jgi:hypothetical protein
VNRRDETGGANQIRPLVDAGRPLPLVHNAACMEVQMKMQVSFFPSLAAFAGLACADATLLRQGELSPPTRDVLLLSKGRRLFCGGIAAAGFLMSSFVTLTQN